MHIVYQLVYNIFTNVGKYIIIYSAMVDSFLNADKAQRGKMGALCWLKWNEVLRIVIYFNAVFLSPPSPFHFPHSSYIQILEK